MVKMAINMDYAERRNRGLTFLKGFKMSTTNLNIWYGIKNESHYTYLWLWAWA